MASAAAHYDALPLAGRGTSREAGCIAIYVKPYRALVRYAGTAFEFHPDRPTSIHRCLGAVCEGRIAQASGGLEIRGSDEPAHAVPEPFVRRHVKQFRLGTDGVTSRSAPKIGPRRSQNRAKRTQASRDVRTSGR